MFGLFGGGKEVQTPRARSYYELHGIYPYKEVKKLVEEMLKTGALENTLSIIKKKTEMSKKEISHFNRASSLSFFVDAQQRLFIEELSEMFDYHNSGHFC